MNGFLLDTNCLSELVRSNPQRRVLEWIDSADEQTLYISVLTLGEIRKGTAALAPGRRRAQLEVWIETGLKRRFAGRILSIDGDIAERWGVGSAQAKKDGRPMTVVDGLLAATAQQYDLTLVTRNVSDFEATGISILNPWLA